MNRVPLDEAITVTTLDGLGYPGRSLLASIDGRLVGTLSERGNLWAFTYAPEWLASAGRFALAPSLPLQEASIHDGASFRPVQWYFDNLLPEEAQRELMAGDARVASGDAFGLLCHYGAESAGSLTLLPEGKVLEPGGRAELTDAELSRRIRALPHHSLAAGSPKRMSLAGAQHKLAVIEQDGALFQPIGAEPSTHVLKPDNTDKSYPHSVANEWFVMRLAAAMGLDVPRVSRRYVPEPAFLVERFDRERTPAGVRRLHTMDACQLLNLDRVFKYRGSLQVLADIVESCRGKLSARFRLFDWLVFNVLVGNSDAHLKNLSFLMGPEGIQLAPHYDLLSTVCYETGAFGQGWPENSTLAWPILGVERFSELSFDLLVEAGQALGLKPRTAADRLAMMQASIFEVAGQLLGEVGAENAELGRRLPIGPQLEGEMRCLRAITHTVIREMVARLAP